MATRQAKIRFYAGLKQRVSDPAWPDGRIPLGWFRDGAPKRFDPETDQIVDAKAPGLNHLSYGANGTAYVNDFDASPGEPRPDVYLAEVPGKTRDFLHLRVWRVRMSQLPSRHDVSDGTTSPIQLTRTQGLAEATDLVLFRDACIVGWLINRAGPSQRDVLRYLEDRTAVSMRLVPLHREDALDLVRGDLVRAVDVEVVAGHFEVLATVTEEIGDAAKKVNTPGLRTIRVAFSAEKEEGGNFWQWWQPRLRKLVGLGPQEVRRLDVLQGGSGDLAAQTVDLLSQAIGLEATVELEGGRTVEASDARRAVVDGFNSHLELISRAADQLNAIAENQRTERRKPGRRPSPGVGTVSA